jgi:hypothetical protein
LCGTQGSEQVNALHLRSEGQLGNQATTSVVPNDGTTGTTQFQLAKINSGGNAINSGTSDTGVFCFAVVSATSKAGNARLAVGGIATVKANTTGYTRGHFIGTDNIQAGTGKDLGSISSAIPSGYCVTGVALTTAAANANGTVLVAPFCK